MARRRTTKAKTAKPKAKPKAKTSGPRVPAWVWLFTGVATGLFAAFLVYLAGVKGSPLHSYTHKPEVAKAAPATSTQNRATPTRGVTTPASTSTKPANTASTSAQNKPAASKPANANNVSQASSSAGTTESTTKEPFQFYQILRDAPAEGAPSALKGNNAEPTVVETKGKPSTPTQTLLQTGSFQNPKDADAMRANLILLGLPASVQKVELKPGDTRHRVQVGPFTSAEQLSRAQSTLKEAHIQHINIRPKRS
ncbi:Hypothetical protein HDN1F_23560 [gamma proteobacterium HdN1]|nr:Hypothetical protein HDN1F_23560 [gamma proteobacterium HdN1]